MENIKFGCPVRTDCRNLEVQQEFCKILNIAIQAMDEQVLRTHFKLSSFIYFEVGFGGSHMWVKQVGYLNDNKNLIQVNF